MNSQCAALLFFDSLVFAHLTTTLDMYGISKLKNTEYSTNFEECKA